MINFWNIPASDSYLETPSLPLCKIDKLSFICIISIWMWVREEGREMAGLDFISYLYLSKSSLIYFNESPHLKIQVGARATTFLQQILATWSCWMWWCFLLYLTAQKVPTGYCVSVCSHLNIDHCKNWLQFIDINNKQSTIFSL